MPRGRAGWDEDDLDDGYDDYDYDEYEEYEEQTPKEPAAGASKQASGRGAAPAAMAGASKFAQSLCDPPPSRPNGKPQKGAKKAVVPSQTASSSFPVAPPPSGLPADLQPFDFKSPSPDEQARSAIGKAKPAAGIHLAPSKTPTAKAAQQAAEKTKQQKQAAAAGPSSVSAVADSLASVDLGSSSSNSGSSNIQQQRHLHKHAHNKAPWQPLMAYNMEPDLAREVAKAIGAAADSEQHGGKTPLHLVVMGHVDAGKSTLMGRLLHDLGYVSAKEAHRNLREAQQAGKASFSWAWVLDERPDERSRGVTVDVAMARFATDKHSITLLDAPGHRDFVPNMISGAAQADAALLLVDGSPGGFEAGFTGEGGYGQQGGGYGGGGGFGARVAGGQTKEHAQLARSLGVEQLAVVISKLDTCDYSEARFEYIKSQLLPFLKSCGFKEAALQWLPAVGPLGLNLTQPPAEPLLSSWWSGPTVVQAIDSFKPKPRLTSLPLRLPIHDVFKGKHGGLSVGGKLEAGAVKVGSKVMVMPSHEVGTVKTLEVDGKPASLALAGDSVDIAITGLEPTAAFQGSVLCHLDFPVRLAASFEARVLVLDVSVPLLKGAAVTVHAHTAREAGVVSGLLALLDGKTGEVVRAKPRCLLKGQTALVQVTPSRSMCLEDYSDLKALGRIALREGGRTVAVGLVTKVTEAEPSAG